MSASLALGAALLALIAAGHIGAHVLMLVTGRGDPRARGLAVCAGYALAPMLWGVPALLARLLGASASGAAVVTVASLGVLGVWSVRRRPAVLHTRTAEPIAAMSAAPVIALALAIPALAVLLNPVLTQHSDAWFHIAVTARVHDTGVPPLDPYYAGMPLAYFWYFHVFLDAVSTALHVAPEWVMAAANVLAAGVFAASLAELAGTLGGDARARRWAAALGFVGINPHGWLVLIARSLTGPTHGATEWVRAIAGGSLSVLGDLGWKYTGSVAFWPDKFFVGTAFSLAMPPMVLLAVVAVQAARVEADAAPAPRLQRWAPAILSAALAFTLAMMHAVLARATFASFAAALLAGCAAHGDARSRRARLGSLLRAGAGAAAGLALAGAYLYCLLAGKDRAPVGAPDLDPWNIWTGMAAGALVWMLAVPALRKAAEREPGWLAAVGWPVGTMALAALAPLPGPNENKFLYPALAVAAVLAAPGAVCVVAWLEARAGRWATAALVTAVLAPTPAIGLAAQLLDAGAFAPGRLDPAPDEVRCAEWLRTQTPREAVLLDGGGRVDILAASRRDLLWGGPSYAEQWGYPRVAIGWREQAVRDAFAGGLTAQDRAALASLERPVYCIARAGCPPPGPAAALHAMWRSATLVVYAVDTGTAPRGAARARQ